MDKNTQRIICCVCCCPFWFTYYSFLHNTCRAFDVCLKVFNGISSTLFKVLYVIFMYFCGFSCVSCAFCVIGIVHCFGAPFEKYKAAGSWVDAFHAMVYEQSCDMEGKVTDILNKIFKK